MEVEGGKKKSSLSFIHFRLQLRDRKSKRREIHWRARVYFVVVVVVKQILEIL
jgi:hypothetical protein